MKMLSDNRFVFEIDDVIFWCEEVVNTCKNFNFDVFTEKNPSKLKEFVECCKDLLEECIYLNESVFLKDKSVRIRKIKFDNDSPDNDKNGVWIGEWEEMLDRMRDGMVGYYRFGVSGQRVLNEMEEVLDEMEECEREEKGKEKM